MIKIVFFLLLCNNNPVPEYSSIGFLIIGWSRSMFYSFIYKQFSMSAHTVIMLSQRKDDEPVNVGTVILTRVLDIKRRGVDLKI